MPRDSKVYLEDILEDLPSNGRRSLAYEIS